MFRQEAERGRLHGAALLDSAEKPRPQQHGLTTDFMGSAGLGGKVVQAGVRRAAYLHRQQIVARKSLEVAVTYQAQGETTDNGRQGAGERLTLARGDVV